MKTRRAYSCNYLLSDKSLDCKPQTDFLRVSYNTLLEHCICFVDFIFVNNDYDKICHLMLSVFPILSIILALAYTHTIIVTVEVLHHWCSNESLFSSLNSVWRRLYHEPDLFGLLGINLPSYNIIVSQTVEMSTILLHTLKF